MKAEYSTVLQALEIANRALRRVVSLDEIIKALSDEEVINLESAYSNNLDKAVAGVLEQLHARGVIFSPGRIGRQRYYGSANVLDPNASPLPDQKSRRQRVLALVRATVAELGRAVRMGDVIEHAKNTPAFSDIQPVFISRNLLSLVWTKEINCIGSIRGDEKGTHLYLPSELDPASYWPKEPLTWLGLVEKAFNEIWEERMSQAVAAGRKPRPVSTGEVRARLAALPEPHPNLKDAQFMVNAMQQLARTEEAVIRKIEREGQRNVLWVPVSVSDEEVEAGDTYAKDTERAGEAVRRAVLRLGRPVNLREVREETENDPCLQPVGTSSLASILADAAKETIDFYGKSRRPRVTRHVLRVGRVDGDAYYFHDLKGLPLAQSYLRLRQIKSSWQLSYVEKNLHTLQTCSVISIAVGRAMMVVAQARQFLTDLDRLLEEGSMNAATSEEAKVFRSDVGRIAEEALQRLSLYRTHDLNLPTEVSLTVPGWTAEQLLPIIRPLYPRARKATIPRQLVTILDSKGLRRFPNPAFESRFSNDPLTAAEYLYDRADALLRMATLWGGYECRLQANYARNELGWLRDPRFVYPAVDSQGFHGRLAAISCLAFLWSDEGNALLRRVAADDPDYGIRQSALWAYALAGGEAGREFAMRRAKDDPEVRVRAFAEKIIQPGAAAIWTM